MKVYFDANYSQYIARAFNFFELTGRENEVFSTVQFLYEDASDEEIVKYVAENKGVLFTKDSDFVKVQLIIELMKSYNIGLFYLKTPKKEIYWDTILILTKAYMKSRLIFQTKYIPYYYEIMSNGNIKERLL
jgi:predicted nuclease of predicted toxin-antitoxin system